MVAFDQVEPGLFVVHYGSKADMLPEQQRSLEIALRRAGGSRPVGVVFIIERQVLTVDPAVPAFWAGLAGDHSVCLAAIGVVSQSFGVKVAASSFGIRSALENRPLRVRVFEDEVHALEWARAILGSGSELQAGA